MVGTSFCKDLIDLSLLLSHCHSILSLSWLFFILLGSLRMERGKTMKEEVTSTICLIHAPWSLYVFLLFVVIMHVLMDGNLLFVNLMNIYCDKVHKLDQGGFFYNNNVKNWIKSDWCVICMNLNLENEKYMVKLLKIQSFSIKTNSKLLVRT